MWNRRNLYSSKASYWKGETLVSVPRDVFQSRSTSSSLSGVNSFFLLIQERKWMVSWAPQSSLLHLAQNLPFMPRLPLLHNGWNDSQWPLLSDIVCPYWAGMIKGEFISTLSGSEGDGFETTGRPLPIWSCPGVRGCHWQGRNWMRGAG